MRKLLFIILLSVISISAQANEQKLYIYCWAEELPQKVIDEFVKESGVQVVLSTYDNNESMYSKLKLLGDKAGYDIVCPSSYFIGKMKQDKLLQLIDKSKIPSFKNIDPDALNQSFDPNNEYSIPFMFSYTGILYNTAYIKDNIDSWGDLFNPNYKGKVMLVDDMREVFHAALTLLGYSGNETNEVHIKQAYEKLTSLIPNVKLFSSESTKVPYISEEVIIGMNWNGEAYIAMKENPNLKFIYPKEGAVLSFDNFSIPVGAKNLDNAYKFISFIHRPEIAKQIAEELGYSVPNQAMLEIIDPDLKNNQAIFPPKEVIKNGLFHEDLGKVINIHEMYWEKLKTNSQL
ncbi:Putative PotD-like ABC transporter substrate-binding protein [Candidatus Trichorickettsia mobilis]|uniref:Putrescine-binding periplasmic protein n=1 Tax=Candidatus Trichorickettsia mobilis TaxID=1346319 RepID=A0ABZ0UVI3_9RICK|nr:extracellular solute-binding protein [Candidatus Trichorickettsia mobilis]WPY00924.1 Putative PotD-like ABC transporter substrate-binding protein [Candidatus Trichorickettsia mobilis]